MTEQIGLLADLDLNQWDLAVSRYLQSIEDMKNAANGIAGNISSGFSGLDGMLSGVASSIAGTFMDIGKGVLSALTDLAQQILENYQELGKNLLIVVGGITASVTAAIGGAAKGLVDWAVGGIESNTTFEQNMADIASVLRKTRQEVEPLANTIDTLALDPKLVVSTQQASETIDQLARNGLDMTQIMNGAAKAAILLANATGTSPGSFSEAADVATMAMQMFNLKAEDYNHIADVSQGVVNNSRIELDDWALALGNGGAAAGAFNVSLDDFATGIAATINLYHSARQAGTGLTNFLERLVPTTIDASDEMRKLGLFSGLSGKEFDKLAGKIQDTQQKIAALDPSSKNYQTNLKKLTTVLQDQQSQLNAGNNAFFDANGNLKDLAQVSEILKNATKDLSGEERIEAYRRIFGNDALETAIGFANEGADAFNNLKDSIVVQNSAVDAAATRTATLEAHWENLQDIWSAIQRKSGAGFNDMLLKLVDYLTKLTNDNQFAIIAFFRELAEWIGQVVDAAMPLIERVLPIVLKDIIALAQWLFNIVKGKGAFNDWLKQMSPGLQKIVVALIGIVETGNKFIHWLVDAGREVLNFLSPYIQWIKQNITLKDVLIAAAGAITVYLAPAIIRMVSISMLAISAVSSIRRAWETDWMGIRTFFEDLWPRIEGPLKEFVNGFLLGDWKMAWQGMTGIVGAVVKEIVIALESLHNTFGDIAALLLRGEFHDAWNLISKWAIDKLEDIKKYLPDWADDLIGIVQGLLGGKWQDAWNSAKQFAFDVYADIIAGLEALQTPFTNFLADVLQGKWAQAWEDAKQSVIEVRDFIVNWLNTMSNPFATFFSDVLQGKWVDAWTIAKDETLKVYNAIIGWLIDLHKPFSDFIALILEGQWRDAWTIASGWAISQLEALKAYVPLWAGDFISVIQNLIGGNWKAAWIDAKQGVTELLAAITQGLLDLHQPFTDFIALILEGQWKDAWTVASGWAITQLEALKGYVPTWAGDFISVIQNLLKGDWKTAWIDAKKVVTDILTDIGEAVRGLNTPFTTFIADVLEGKWNKAWLEFKDLLDPLNGMLQTIVITVGLLGGALLLTNSNVTGFITGWIQALGVITPVISSMAGFITTAALLATGLYLLSEPFTQLQQQMNTFRQNMMDLVNNTAIPAWLRGFFVDAVAISLAIEEWVKALETLGIQINLTGESADGLFGPSGSFGPQGMNSLQQIQMDIIEVAGAFEILGGLLEETAVRAKIVWAALSGQNTDALWKQVDEISARRKEIAKLFSADFSGSLDPTSIDPSKESPIKKFVQNMFSTDVQKDIQDSEDKLKAALQTFEGNITAHYLSLQEIGDLGGKGTLEAFVNAYASAADKSVQLSTVGTFAQKISALAEYIKEGYANAGDASVIAYVKELAASSGIAEDGAFQLAQNIINKYGYGLDTVGGVVVPDAYEKNFVDPLKAQAQPTKEAGIVVGQNSVDGVVAGTNQSSGSFLDTINGLIGKATNIYDALTPATTKTGSDSVTGMATATTQTQPQVASAFQGLVDQANKIVSALPPAATQTGTDAVTGLGTAVDQNKQPTLDTFGNLVSNIDDTTHPIITNLGDTGTQAVQSLATSMSQSAPSQLNPVFDQIHAMFEQWSENEQTSMKDAGMFVDMALAEGLEANSYRLNDAADQMGRTFRDKINEYLTIVINNFKNLADNITAVTDFSKFNTLGTNIGNAIKSGIDSTQSAVQDAGSQLVNAASTGVTTTAQIASPSKLFQMLAHYVGDGFVLGLQDSLKNIQQATSAIIQQVASTTTQGGQTVTTAIQQLMSKFMDVFKTGDISGAETSLGQGIGGLSGIESGAGILGTSGSSIPALQQFLQGFDVFRKSAAAYQDKVDSTTNPQDKQVLEQQYAATLATFFSNLTGNLQTQLQQRVGSLMQAKSGSAIYNSTSSPLTIVNNIYNQMDQAQLQYMMQQTLNGVKA